MDLLGIKAFAFDIDGVATDGGVFCNGDGDLLRTYDAKDGFAIRMAVMNGFPVAVITGGSSESILRRFAMCGVDEEDIYLHSRIKLDDFKDFCMRHLLKPENVMYFGDDLPDVPILKACGIGVAPADAVEEVKQAADYVSPYGGGHGCVRHAIEMVLKEQGRWALDDKKYKQMF